MSHNPNDNLVNKAFESQNDELIKNALNSGYIKSQDELNPCNEGKRKSDVLLATIERCERLQKQLDIAVKALYLLLQGEKTIKIGKSVELIETYALNKIEELDND